MAEVGNWQQGATRKLLIAAYREEAARFAANVADLGLKRLTTVFQDFPGFLGRWRKTLQPSRLLPAPGNAAGVLIPPSRLREDAKWAEIVRLAEIAGACRVFHGWEFPLEHIRPGKLEEYVGQRLRQTLDAREDAMQSALAGLQVGDALRAISLWVLGGLMEADRRKWRQLSFAAGAANKELEGLHAVPRVVTGPHSTRSAPTLQLDTRVDPPANTVLIDNTPAAAKLYEWFNTTQPHRILAINEDFDTAMEGLPGLLQARRFGLRNAIAGIHADHRIIPDAGAFISVLRPVLAEQATLLMSVGAGDTLEDFEGRIAMMEALARELTAQGLQPVRLRLCEGASSEEQRRRPVFGLPPLATFEMLFCSLGP